MTPDNHIPDPAPDPTEGDLLAHLQGSLSDALEAIDRARSLVGTSLVWTSIAKEHSDDGGDE